MRRELSLRGEIFDQAVKDFDLKLAEVLRKLHEQGLDEGAVTLKVDVRISRYNRTDEDGVDRLIEQPFFPSTCSASVVQKTKSSHNPVDDFKLRVVDGQLELRDLDENTLFDFVEGGAEDVQSNGT